MKDSNLGFSFSAVSFAVLILGLVLVFNFNVVAGIDLPFLDPGNKSDEKREVFRSAYADAYNIGWNSSSDFVNIYWSDKLADSNRDIPKTAWIDVNGEILNLNEIIGNSSYRYVKKSGRVWVETSISLHKLERRCSRRVGNSELRSDSCAYLLSLIKKPGVLDDFTGYPRYRTSFDTYNPEPSETGFNYSGLTLDEVRNRGRNLGRRAGREDFERQIRVLNLDPLKTVTGSANFTDKGYRFVVGPESEHSDLQGVTEYGGGEVVGIAYLNKDMILLENSRQIPDFLSTCTHEILHLRNKDKKHSEYTDWFERMEERESFKICKKLLRRLDFKNSRNEGTLVGLDDDSLDRLENFL